MAEIKYPGAAMVDLKYTAKEKREESKEIGSMPDGSNMPDYPWGLTLDLDDSTLKKLGVNELPDVGDEYHLIAVAKVTRLSSSADEKESENRMTLQICYMQMVHEDEEPDENESAAYENRENKAGVKNALTNSMR